MSSPLTQATGTRAALASTSSPSTASGSAVPTGSTRMRIRPPQASPAAKASPSLTPYSSILDLPSAMASSASATTAPSTQPPETDPAISPAPETASWPPTRRGALPHVSTTVARAAPLPSRCHARAFSGMSSKRSMPALPARSIGGGGRLRKGRAILESRAKAV